MSHSKLAYSKMHPVILHGSHPLTRLTVRGEHVHLMHAGPTLLMSSLSRRYHITSLRKMVRSVTRQCITCRRHTVKPTSQLLGQLLIERVTPGSVFTRVGVDYAGPFQIKYGYVKKPTILKAYICLFVCLAVKAVHLELVSDLTTEAFIATLRRFTAQRGHPQLIWSDHGTNFVGANRELRELNVFLSHQITQDAISEFCSAQSTMEVHSRKIASLWWDMGISCEKCQEPFKACCLSSQIDIRRTLNDSHTSGGMSQQPSIGSDQFPRRRNRSTHTWPLLDRKTIHRPIRSQILSSPINRCLYSVDGIFVSVWYVISGSVGRMSTSQV